MPGSTQYCLQSALPEGLHLVEIRLRDNPFTSPLLVHTWAIEIAEPDG